VTGEAGSVVRDDNDSAVGELVCAVSDDQQTEALVVLRLDHDGALTLNGQALDWRKAELPYPLPA
jgi:hypothetical protein